MSLYSGPWNTFITKFPLGSKILSAIPITVFVKSIDLNWSIFLIPHNDGDASEITTLAFPPIKFITFSWTSVVVKFPLIPWKFSSGKGFILFKSTPITRPSSPTFSKATWDHPPGAAPRSTTVSPSLISLNFLSNCLILYDALER